MKKVLLGLLLAVACLQVASAQTTNPDTNMPQIPSHPDWSAGDGGIEPHIQTGTQSNIGHAGDWTNQDDNDGPQRPTGPWGSGPLPYYHP